MSQNLNPDILYAGLDVAKSSLQLQLQGQSHALANDSQGHAQILKLLRPFPQAQLVCEATGGYEQAVVRALQAAHIPVAVVEPGRVRCFARAHGRRAKTDPIDAATITEFAASVKPAPTAAPTPQQKQLADVSRRRRQLLNSRVAEANRAEHYADPFSRQQSKQYLKFLERQIKACDQTIQQLIHDDAELAQKAARLREIPGVGPVVAATVLAEMPELGNLSPTTAAALAGVAPYNNDSGDKCSPRHIAGGRAALRNVLYMAALTAVKHDRILKAFYQRLRANGKKPKVALTAAMRKLIVLMNHLLKNNQFQLAH
jgi:transposase